MGAYGDNFVDTTRKAVWKRYKPARRSVLLTTCLSFAVCLCTDVGLWAFLPLMAIQLEFIAQLYDWEIMGRVIKKPSPKGAFEKRNGSYTWQQVAEHNTEESSWIAIDGRVYDITSFLDHHPGGKEFLLLSIGREASDIFRSYHPFTDIPKQLLRKFDIGKLTTFEHPIYKPDDNGFYKECCKRVKHYFWDNKLNPKDPKMCLKRMIPTYIAFFGCYYIMHGVRGISWPQRCIAAVIVGVSQSVSLLGWMHDASHAAFGNSPRWWWIVTRFSLDYVCGSSSLSWHTQHIIGHHAYTNVLGADPDLTTSLEYDPRRFVPSQKYRRHFKYQYIYMPFLYGIYFFKTRLQDFTEIFSRLMNGPIRINPISTQDYVRLVSSKCVFIFYRCIVPVVFFHALSLKEHAVLFIIAEVITGYHLALVFEVSHISDQAQFLNCEPSKRADSECPAVFRLSWAEAQVMTTVDYGYKSAVTQFLSGNLNYQIAHHLFPGIAQYHLRGITPIVAEVMKKYGYRYRVLKDFREAFRAHIQHLYNMGIDPSGLQERE